LLLGVLLLANRGKLDSAVIYFRSCFVHSFAQQLISASALQLMDKAVAFISISFSGATPLSHCTLLGPRDS
jgi:hypothetical protein